MSRHQFSVTTMTYIQSRSRRIHRYISIFPLADVPFITKIDASDSFISGTDQNLVCVARGYPRPNIYWTSDSVSFNTGYGSPDFSLAPYTENIPDGYTFVTSILRLHPVIPEDHGTYTCIATNSEGETNATVEITVLCKI